MKEVAAEPTICPQCGTKNRVKKSPASGIFRCGVCKAALNTETRPSRGPMGGFLNALRGFAGLVVVALPIYVGSFVLSSPGPLTEITLPIRIEARKLADVLIACRRPPEEAYQIVLRKIDAPGMWWVSEILPGLSVNQRSLLAAQHKRTEEVIAASTEKARRAELTERAILELLQRESGLSATECFHAWQNGLGNQSEGWWGRHSARLTPESRKALKYMRADLLDQSR